MNQALKLSIVEMELAAMDAKIQSMRQTMVKSSDPEFKQLSEISDLMDKLRRQMGAKIEMLSNQ